MRRAQARLRRTVGKNGAGQDVFEHNGLHGVPPFLRDNDWTTTYTAPDYGISGGKMSMRSFWVRLVKTYWQLWRDYPDSPYTLMARRKLEAVGP